MKQNSHILTLTQWTVFFVLSIVFFACHKDQPVCSACETCNSLNRKVRSGNIGIQPPPFHKDTLYKSPCFNPVNSNEFIYFKQKEKQLIKRNILSGYESILLKDVYINGEPSWNKNGWIVFAGLDLVVYKIKDNGTGFQVVTNIFENSGPVFSSDGNTILSNVLLGNNIEEVGHKFLTLDGKRIDSIQLNKIDNIMYPVAWRNNNLIAGGITLNASTQYGLGLFNLNTHKFQILHQEDYITAAPRIECVQWHPDGINIYYTTLWNGFYKFNIKTMKNEKIKNTCDSRTYTNFSISPDGTKIIAQRRDAVLIDSGYNILDYDYIVQMDIDGKNEKVIVK